MNTKGQGAALLSCMVGRHDALCCSHAVPKAGRAEAPWRRMERLSGWEHAVLRAEATSQAPGEQSEKLSAKPGRAQSSLPASERLWGWVGKRQPRVRKGSWLAHCYSCTLPLLLTLGIGLFLLLLFVFRAWLSFPFPVSKSLYVVP